ncbi:MAG: DUF5781 family protein [Halobacteriales archaeon]
MDLSVHGPGPAAPFLRARDRFETDYDLSLPAEVRVREDPDERTWAAHYDDRHVLNISRRAATSAMAAGLALHEFAHMRRYEDDHPSHVQPTDEALFLALAGKEVERRRLAGCYQIANHMKDVYADDITLSVGPTDRLVSFLESELAAALADRPADGPAEGRRLSADADPEMTVINAAFAVGLLERHDLLDPDHHIYDLARAAGRDAPHVDFDRFRRRFRSLARDPGESGYRKALVDVTRAYATGGSASAAD